MAADVTDHLWDIEDIVGLAGDRVLKTIDDPRGGRRVEIDQRANGTFGFEEWTYGVDENAWHPSGRYSYAVIDTLKKQSKTRELGSRGSIQTDLVSAPAQTRVTQRNRQMVSGLLLYESANTDPKWKTFRSARETAVVRL